MATPAKFAAPRPRNACNRERLFAWLYRSRDSAGIWESGLSSAGKTRLIASCVDARDLSCFWYDVDRRDADIAGFFYDLGVGARQLAPRRRKSLPLFIPERARGVAAFSRTFFRELFSRLYAPCLRVLDNYKDTTEASQIHDVLTEEWAEIPQGLCVAGLLVSIEAELSPRLQSQVRNDVHTRPNRGPPRGILHLPEGVGDATKSSWESHEGLGSPPTKTRRPTWRRFSTSLVLNSPFFVDRYKFREKQDHPADES
jgi:hypothetical protein